MSIPLIINGTTYEYPETGDTNWGPDATDWASAVTVGMLQKAGGLFQLLAETDFGSGYGIKALYLKSRTASPADAGQIRFARTDLIEWRNQAGDDNLELGVDSSDRLTFNGNPIVPSSALTASRAVVTDASSVLTSSATTATQVGYLSSATGTTGTTSTNLVFSASPTFTGTMAAAAATFSGTVIIGGTSDASQGGTKRIVIDDDSGTGTNTQGIAFQAHDGTKNPRAFIVHSTASDFSTQTMTFDSDYSASSAVANWVFNSGKVGIGGSPTTMLDIINAAADPSLRLYSSGAHNATIDLDSNRSSNGQTLGRLSYSWNSTEIARIAGFSGTTASGAKDDGSLSFQVKATGASLTERLLIGSDGSLTASAYTTAGPLITSSSGVFSSEAQLAVTRGGTGTGTYTTGNILYSDATNSLAKLAPNATATKMYLTMTSSVPSWSTEADADIPLTSAHILMGNGSNVAADVAVSGDLTALNTGAFTVAKIQTTTVSGTTGTGNVVFSASPTLTGTVAAAAMTLSGDFAIATSKFTVAAASGNTVVAGTLGVTGVATFTAAPVFSSASISQLMATDASKALTSIAYASANTASAMVQRDGSGNFAAGTITAALTGTASGNTTYTANNHGVVISGSANTMTVLAPDSSATKVLKSGGSSADPSWLAYDNANTVSTLVFRDSSGNFSAGTVTAALTGTASGNLTYTANNHGVLFSGSGNTVTVLAPDASTTKVLVSGGASADPSWLTSTGTGNNVLSASPTFTGTIIAAAMTMSDTLTINAGANAGVAKIDVNLTAGTAINGYGADSGHQNGATGTFTLNSSAGGLFIVSNGTTGAMALCLLNVTTITIVSDPNSKYSTGSNVADKDCLSMSSSTLSIQHNSATGSNTFKVFWLRTE